MGFRSLSRTVNRRYRHRIQARPHPRNGRRRTARSRQSRPAAPRQPETTARPRRIKAPNQERSSRTRPTIIPDGAQLGSIYAFVLEQSPTRRNQRVVSLAMVRQRDSESECRNQRARQTLNGPAERIHRVCNRALGPRHCRPKLILRIRIQPSRHSYPSPNPVRPRANPI